MSERARLLVVDDESSIVDFLSLLFEEEGYSVETARSVTEARQAMTGRSFDLILCDVMMPDGTVEQAWVYFYNAPIGRAPRIASGDYLEHTEVR